MKHYLIAIAATAIALTGCAPQAAQQSAATEDFNVGIAKTCTPSPVDLAKTSPATATITMTNDGFCAIHVKDKDGKPFKFGLLKVRPQHGFINIHQVNGDTRIDYTADSRYVGPDRFTVALASAIPNTPDTTLSTTVTVAMGAGLPPEPAPTSAPAARPAPAKRKATPTRARR